MKFVSGKLDCRLNGTWNIYKRFVKHISISCGFVNVMLFSMTTEGSEFKVPVRDITFLIPF